MKSTSFHPGKFALAYLTAAFLACAIGFPLNGPAGASLLLLSVVMPVPFFVAGYCARWVRHSVVFGVLLLALALIFTLAGVRALMRLFERY